MNSYDKSILATQFFTEISAAMFKSNAETLEYKKVLKKNDTKERRQNFKHKKKRWNERLYQLHKFKCYKYLKYRDSVPAWSEEHKLPFVKAKREYVQYQKFAEKESSNKKFKYLKDLFKFDLNGFWREVEKMTQIKQLINIPLNEIKQQYQVLFNTSNFPDDERDSNVKKQIRQIDK